MEAGRGRGSGLLIGFWGGCPSDAVLTLLKIEEGFPGGFSRYAE